MHPCKKNLKSVQEAGKKRSGFRLLYLILIVLFATSNKTILSQSTTNSSAQTGSVSQNTSASNTGNSRYLIKFPMPEYTFSDSGVVVVIVRINNKGRIIKAQIDKNKSTTQNKMLYNDALKAANYAKYNSIDKDTIETGQLTYIFKLK
jgi:TonB family protein